MDNFVYPRYITLDGGDPNARSLVLALPTGSATDSTTFIITEKTNLDTDWGVFDGETEPGLALTDTAGTKAMELRYNGTFFNFSSVLGSSELGCTMVWNQGAQFLQGENQLMIFGTGAGAGRFVSDGSNMRMYGTSTALIVGSTGTPSLLSESDGDLYVNGEFEVSGVSFFKQPLKMDANIAIWGSIGRTAGFTFVGTPASRGGLTYATDEGVYMVAGSSDGNGNHQWSLVSGDNYLLDHDRDTKATNPTLNFFAANSPDESNNRFGSISHNASNFVLSSGANVGTGTSPATINNGILVSPSELTSGAAGNYAMRIERTLNDTGAAGGSDTFAILELDATPTDVTGWDELYVADLKWNGTTQWLLDNTGNVFYNGFSHYSTTAGITASVTQTQGQGALTTELNEVSTVANTNDTVTLPSAEEGRKVIVINNGANTLQIFPTSGDNLGAGVDTATTLAAGSNVTYVAYDTTNWEVV